jgi:hypothetical protein
MPPLTARKTELSNIDGSLNYSKSSAKWMTPIVIAIPVLMMVLFCLWELCRFQTRERTILCTAMDAKV